MHPLFLKASSMTEGVIGGAIEVHRLKGPGLIESIYEKGTFRELELRGYSSASRWVVQIEYKGFVFEETLRCDLIVEDCLLLESKSVEKILPIHKAQLLSYMKLDVPISRLINFKTTRLVDDLPRLILPGANQ